MARKTMRSIRTIGIAAARARRCNTRRDVEVKARALKQEKALRANQLLH